MKSLASILFVAAVLFSQLMFSGCLPPEPEPLPPSALLYAPAEGLSGPFVAARNRIFEASGIVLQQDASGTPIAIGEDYEDNPHCAITIVEYRARDLKIYDSRITVWEPRPGCYPTHEEQILHELFHVLRRDLETGETEDQHAPSGIFSRVSNRSILDEASLTALCETGLCTKFEPEE